MDVQKRGKFTEEQFEGVLLASILIGGRCCQNLATMVKSNLDKVHIVQWLRDPLCMNGFSDQATEWIITNILQVNEQAIDLIHKIKDRHLEEFESYMAIQRVVDIQEDYEVFDTLMQVNCAWITSDEVVL